VSLGSEFEFNAVVGAVALVEAACAGIK